MLQPFPTPEGMPELDFGRCRHAAMSDVGRRQKNQDRWFADDQRQVYLVADGMGGRPAGEQVAEAVVSELPSRLERAIGRESDLHRPATMMVVMAEVSRLSYEIWKATLDQPALAGMGATLVLAIVRGRRALVVHLGDSRAYHLRGFHCAQVTRDHNLLQELLDAGRLSPDDARGHIAATQLTRYAGMNNIALPDAQIVDLQVGDRLLLCTDGLHGAVEHARLAEVAIVSSDRDAACQSLVREAKIAGSMDNITVVMVEVVK